MSVTYCPHCSTLYDQDYNVEHEEECLEESRKIPGFEESEKSFKDMIESANKLIIHGKKK